MFEVYVGRIGNTVVYVGQGKLGRHKHLTSGISHVYEANRAHFLGDRVDVTVTLVESKVTAVEKEAVLILEMLPIWNKSLVPNTGMRSTLVKTMKRYENTGVVLHKTCWYLLEYAKENLMANNTIYVPTNGIEGCSRQTLYKLHLQFHNRKKDSHKVYESITRVTPEVGENHYVIKFQEYFMSHINSLVPMLPGVTKIKVINDRD